MIGLAVRASDHATLRAGTLAPPDALAIGRSLGLSTLLPTIHKVSETII